VRDAGQGLIAADLGGGLIKQRIARPGEGKSGGFRTLIVYRAGLRAFFIHGFAKNEADNVGGRELVALKRLASELAAYSDLDIGSAVLAGALTEVMCDEEAIS